MIAIIIIIITIAAMIMFIRSVDLFEYNRKKSVFQILAISIIYAIFVFIFDITICNTIKGPNENVVTVDAIIGNDTINIVNDTSQLSVYKYFKYMTIEPKQYEWDSTVK